VLDEHGFGDHRTGAAGSGEPGDRRHQMQKQNGQFAHRTILPRSRHQEMLRNLAIRHAQAVAVRDLADLTQIYQDIGVELLHLYRLAYVPLAPVRDGSWRSVSVRVPTKDLVIRTRSGYYAPRRRRPILQKLGR